MTRLGDASTTATISREDGPGGAARPGPHRRSLTRTRSPGMPPGTSEPLFGDVAVGRARAVHAGERDELLRRRASGG